MKDKKGFTLVELLAVIVILALIMSIAIVSIGGVLKSSRENTFKETALSIISGVKMQSTVPNELKAGTYYFTSNLLDNDNELPFGGKIKYSTVTTTGTSPNAVPGTNGVIGRVTYKEVNATNCKQSTSSYVSVKNVNEKYEFSICLTPATITTTSQKYLYGKEADLYGSSVTTVFDCTVS